MMKSEMIKIINPQNGVKWNEILRLLKEEHPAALRILMETDSLIDFLDSCVAHIVVHRHKMINSGIPREEAEKKIVYHLLPKELLGIEGSYNEGILESLLASLEEREVEVEVYN
jgi:hypothetical protein